MARQGTRQTIAEGIYQDEGGFEVRVKIGKVPKSRRFPAGTGIRALRDAQKALWNELDAELKANPTRTQAARAPQAKDRSLLTAAIDHYLTVAPKTKSSAEKGAFRAWQAYYPKLERRKLTPLLAEEPFAVWRQTLSPRSLRYRRDVIRKLWRVTEGPDVRSPVDKILLPSQPKSKQPVWVRDDAILQVYNRLVLARTPLADDARKKGAEPKYWRHRHKTRRDLKTPARFLVLATCGQRPVQVKLAEPDDVLLWDQPPDDIPGIYGLWWVRPAKGGDRIPCYLNKEQAEAWRRFIAADAWGYYDTRSFARCLRGAGWPKGVRPYNLRHAVGLTSSHRGQDLADIQVHFGHESIETTRGFYVPWLHEKLQGLSRRLEGRFVLQPLPQTKPGPQEAHP